MANAILTAPSYRLPAADQQSILQAAPSPTGKIEPAILLKIEQKRQAFMHKFGSDGL